MFEAGLKEMLREQQALQIEALVSGKTSLTIYLIGGSETRADSRESWRQFAARIGAPFHAVGGYAVKIGSERP